MWVPEVASALKRLPQPAVDVSRDTNMKRAPWDVILVGIETHICVLQTALDALSHGNRVWVVSDAVSSCNAEERGVALARLRQEGARVTTSESLLYELLGDAKDPAYVPLLRRWEAAVERPAYCEYCWLTCATGSRRSRDWSRRPRTRLEKVSRRFVAYDLGGARKVSSIYSISRFFCHASLHNLNDVWRIQLGWRLATLQDFFLVSYGFVFRHGY